ncbi:protein of unknown function DUF477 [Pseudopedobacter saltans DSM 12145]|uniref:TPM domain-containing protein n=1 Tax=Pseudopedobacter saltans (strain ATCC 51119 / DSM 12145 / JCM 21818 / CCUG 39354 / LMG 10337 / NBRC 100064 / NCIMB 13643) TaxID=762903 RepID=F0SBF3_PSESL|nr:TPM domain-containing protein [Pseudopedobacter saltans]ADY50593.1 protein of unknown function DUF477 [Pseudopedobacter saltans DSM 12145]
MKKILFAFLLVIGTLFSKAQDFPPKPNTLVNDYTGTLSNDQKQALENKLVAFDDSTSIQVTVVLIRSLDGYDISDYGYRLGRAWGVGGKEKNTGVIILAAINDRKVTIQTGYGMEGMLPDIITKRIIDNEIKPYFRTGNYYEGLDAATSAIISYNKGEYKGDGRKRGNGEGFPIGLVILIIIIVIVLIGRGGRGGGRNVIGGRGGADIFWWSILNGLGNSGRGGSGGFGGGSGGGFGGFGGGSFGGGGSSGSW